MTKFLRFLMVVVLTAVGGHVMAQGNPGAIKGTVVDQNNEPIINAVIQVTQGGINKGGGVTDFDGNYLIKPLDPSSGYQISIKYLGYRESVVQNILVQPNQETDVNVKLQPTSETLEEVVITEYEVPLIDKNQGGNSMTKTSDEIENMATRNTSTVVSTSVGAYSEKDGGDVSIAGARSDGTLYIIDGVQVVGNRGINLSQGAIDQIQVITSGIPAKYGDAIGGVVSITTKGVSNKLRGNILLERSVDGYNHNLGSFTLSGPLVSKKDTLGNKTPIMGFFLAGDAWYDQDRDPEYHGNYAVKDDVLSELRDNPLVPIANQSGAVAYRSRTETVTAKDLYITKKRQNAEVKEGRLTGRLDFQLADNLNLSAGGSFNYTDQSIYQRSVSLFALNGMPREVNYTGRGFIRLRQSFRNLSSQTTTNEEGVEEERKPLISNAFYTIQADYQIDARERQHPDHKENIFNYAYIGKFNTQYAPIYVPGVDSVTGVYGTRLLVERDANAAVTTFERSEMNPILANYVSQYFRDQGGFHVGDIQSIRARNIVANGEQPDRIYGLFEVPGYAQTFFQKADVQQYSVSVDASFDLQPKETRHSIEFGLYYQQRVESNYALQGPVRSGLWQYMRQLTNTHISLDRNNPIFIINGEEYTKDQIGGLTGINPSPTDTIYYNRVAGDNQSTFDRNLRKKLGVSATDYINIDGLDPSVFDVEMFSADELLNSGNPFVFYSGYDYKGNRQRGQVNFNDFFTKKDENGDYTRDIGSYRPNYIAGYIMDKFEFKDILFNLGLRVERFDANTKVLKDPYSLYGVNTIGDARQVTDEFGNPRIKNTYIDAGLAPENIGDDYVVYVNSNEAPNPQIVGYRNGDDWYDPLGRLIDPALLSQNYNGGSAPQPYLVDGNVRITDSTFDPNTAFTDYTPQINVMPRVSFSFPISDEALFYAHYDVLVQRPKSNVFTRPSDYYFLTANTGSLINNPDLKPEKMFDYEVGFKQKLSKLSAVTISGFYKERKDMTQIRPYLYAYPTTYLTYGNRDFTTTKGMTVRYDMRRNGPLSLDLAYTLQFANGTGSSDNSAVTNVNNPSGPGLLQGFISAGLPNIRPVFPLDNDVRHNIVATIDYRYFENQGPKIGNVSVFEQTGANLIVRTRSGEPYTRINQPLRVGNTIDGQVNGARLPWHYWLDLKVDKSFKLNFHKKDAEVTKPRRAYYVNVYVLINNLLNTRDILDVDRYTGRPDDDGYLSHPQGLQTANNQFNPQSYIDLYSANLIGVGNTRLNLPRRINVGLNFNF